MCGFRQIDRDDADDARHPQNGAAVTRTPADGRFQPGQVWTYRTRPGEEDSRVAIGRIDHVGRSVVVHVSVMRLQIRSPGAEGGIQRRISHAPMEASALRASLRELTAEIADLEGFVDGYNQWRSAADSGHAGFFTIPLHELPSLYERALVG